MFNMVPNMNISKTSVLTLNVRGLNNSLKWNSKADIVLLQETLCMENTDNLFKSTWNGKMFNSCSDSSHSRGVTILFRPNLDMKILNIQYSRDGRSLLINFEFENNIVTAVSVYAPNIEAERIEYFNTLKCWIK